jgi:hypothetical protein
MYLLDANIWLERLLNQAKATEVKQLLDAVKSSQLAVSDFDHTDLQRWTPAQVLASLRPPRPA